MSKASGRVFRQFLSVFLTFIMTVGIMSPALASDGGWNSVIRPGVQAGTGTADYSVELFSPLYQTNNSMVFFAPRFRINPGRDDENEVNVGLGYRQLIMNDEWFVGGNVFYDTMESQNGFRYHQLGLGLEARSLWIDAILNGYVQVGDDTNRLDRDDRFALGRHSLLITRSSEEALSGLDGEVGVLIPGVSKFIETRAYVGGYWYISDLTSDVGGVRARVQVNPVPLVTLNGVYEYDNVNDSVWRADAYLNIPFTFTNIVQGKNPFEGLGDALKWGKGPRGARERMTDRVERDRYVRTVTGEDDPVKVHDMIFVDNSNDTGVEDGSFEHPWDTIEEGVAQAQDGSDSLFNETTPPYIFIFAGDAPYSGGHVLNGGDLSADTLSMLIWGEHYALPGMTPGDYPVVEGSSEDTDNGFAFNGGADGGSLTIRGLQIEDASEDGIYATSLVEADIEDNRFFNNGSDGVFLNFIGSTAYIADNNASGNGDNGIFLFANDSENPTDGGSSFVIKDNTVTDNGEVGIFAWTSEYGEGDTDMTATGNRATGNGEGISLWPYNYGPTGDVNVEVSGNTAEGNRGPGITVGAILGEEGDINEYIHDNFSEYNGTGIYARGTHEGVGNINIDIADNTANNNYGDNIRAENSHHWGEGELNIEITGNSASGAGEGGMGIAVENNDRSGTGDINITVADNTANDNTVENIYINENDLAGAGDLNITVTGNDANNSSNREGIFIVQNVLTGVGDINIAVGGNTVNDNQDDNIYILENDLHGTGDIDIDVYDNFASNSEEEYGINVYENHLYGEGTINVDVTGNHANGNSDVDIYVDANDHHGTGDVNINVSGNQASGSTSDPGIDIRAYHPQGTGNINVTVSGNTANDNNRENIIVYVRHVSTGDINVHAEDNFVSNSYTASGIDISTGHFGDGDTSVTVSGNVANDNWDDNINVDAQRDDVTPGDVSVEVSGNEAVGSETGYGVNVYGFIDYEGNVTLNVADNVANDNWDDNIRVKTYREGDDPGVTDIDVTGNQASGSSIGDGIVVISTSGGTENTYINIEDNIANDEADDGIDVYMTGFGDGDNHLDISGNTANGSGDDGITVTNWYDDSYLDITGNTSDGNSGDGIEIINQGGTLYADGSIEENHITNNSDVGINISNLNGNAYVDIAYNQITGNDEDGVNISNRYGSAYVDVTGNDISGNGGDGVHMSNIGHGELDADIGGNDISGNFGNGVEIYNDIYTFDDTLNADIYGNTIADNGYSGIKITNIYDEAFVTITDNTITGNGKNGGVESTALYDGYFEEGINGIEVVNDNEAYMNLTIDGNTVSGNPVGIAILNSDYSDMVAGVDGNRILDNTGGGLAVVSANSDMDLDITNNEITGNGYFGAVVAGVNDSFADDMFMNVSAEYNTVDDNGLIGIGVGVMNDSFAGNLYLDAGISGNEVSGSYLGIGVGAVGDSAYGLTDSTVDIFGNTVTDNYMGIGLANINDAFGFGDDSYVYMDANVHDNVVTGSEIEGLGVYNYGSYFSDTAGMFLDVTDNSFNDSPYGNGMYLYNDEYAYMTASVEGNEFINNSEDGVRLVNDGSGDEMYVDMGGGEYSAGYNSLYGNGNYDLLNDTGTTVDAEYNWWGNEDGPQAGQIFNTFGSDTDYSNYLTSPPGSI